MRFSWKHLPCPIVGMAAMDGVTDAAMRHITAKHGRPDVMLTEFTSIDGLTHHALRLLRDLHYTPIQRPILAQLYGSSPEAFRACAVLVCVLGFDGVDINMGCPSCTVAQRGGGAALIRTPDLARRIILATKQGVRDWVNGMNMADCGFDAAFIRAVQRSPNYIGHPTVRHPIPVSVKTRIGYDRVDTVNWISHLLETEPDNLSLHGRTLTQKYSGEADWEEIAKAARLVRQTPTTILGNGDIRRPQDVLRRVGQTGVDGVLVGRASMGNPWFFAQYRALLHGGPTETEVDLHARMRVALEHVEYFEYLNETVFQDDPFLFLTMRKHLGWYIRELPGSAVLRQQLFQSQSGHQVKKVFEEFVAVTA